MLGILQRKPPSPRSFLSSEGRYTANAGGKQKEVVINSGQEVVSRSREQRRSQWELRVCSLTQGLLYLHGEFDQRLKEGRTSLAVQWLKLLASTAGDMDSIPGCGTKIPHAMVWPEKKKKKLLLKEQIVWICREEKSGRGNSQRWNGNPSTDP